MKKQNCWEFMKCGRELGGHNGMLSVCPTATAVQLNGTHGGTHGGRSCWVVPNTVCGGRIQGTFAQKYKSCEQCSFYDAVRREERMLFVLAPTLLHKLSGPRQPCFGCTVPNRRVRDPGL